MLDAKRLLDQFLGGGGGSQGDRFGQSGGRTSGGLEDIGRVIGSLTGGSGAGGGSMAAGLAGLLLGTKGGRRLGGSAMKLGGMAMVGSLAYKAYQSWQAGQQGGAPSGSFSGAGGPTGSYAPARQATGWPAAPPAGSPFHPAAEADQQSLCRAILRAMIAAAKADGHVDATEQANVFAAMDRMTLDSDDKAFVMDELRAPLDIDAVARGARNVEEATEIYAASLLAVDVDNPAERGYLQLLAARLQLDEELVRHLHAVVEEAAPAHDGSAGFAQGGSHSPFVPPR
ncbi:tellurite resistance TerB family protein [uncultured Enterovirga sp.]|uniref:tellurite resistance TerB family protein n=1 Tax=uncultured Enterovirga sp. TaxID=2026352 RepID=UPI0035CAB722